MPNTVAYLDILSEGEAARGERISPRVQAEPTAALAFSSVSSSTAARQRRDAPGRRNGRLGQARGGELAGR